MKEKTFQISHDNFKNKNISFYRTIDRKEIVYSGPAKDQNVLPKFQKEIGPQVVQTLTVSKVIS